GYRPPSGAVARFVADPAAARLRLAMTSASLFLASALLLEPPALDPERDPSEDRTPVLTPTQPQPGEPAIAPARIEGERALTEPESSPPAEPPIPVDPKPDQPDQLEGELPSWQADPGP